MSDKFNSNNNTCNNSKDNIQKSTFDSGKDIRINENGPKEGGQPIIRSRVQNDYQEK